jgi:hypothetical protein
MVVRPADLLLQKVDLRFAPITSDLLRRLSYEVVQAVNGPCPDSCWRKPADH